MRKWLPAVPILVGVAVTVAIFGRLPNDVRPDWALIFPGIHDDETIPRAAAAALFPAVSVLIWVALAWGARVRGRHSGSYLSDRTDASAIARFEPTFAVIVTGVVGLMMVLHLTILGSAAGWPVWTTRLLGVVFGLGIAATGNLMPRVRPNWIVGIRTRATLNDPELWLRTHRYFGRCLMVLGFAVAILALIASRYAFVAGIASILIAGILAHAFARPSRSAVSMAW